MRTAVVWPLLLVVTLVDSLSPVILDDWYYDSDILWVRYRKVKIGDNPIPDILVPSSYYIGQFYCLIPIPTGNANTLWGQGVELSERIFGGHGMSNIVMSPQVLCCNQVFLNGYNEVARQWIDNGPLDDLGAVGKGVVDTVEMVADKVVAMVKHKREGCDVGIIDEWYQKHTRKEYIDKFLDDLCHFNFSDPHGRRGFHNEYLVRNQQEICSTSLQTKSTKKTITTTTARTTTTSSTTTTSTTTTTTSTTTTTTATTSTVETTSSTSTQWWNVITQQSSTQNIVEDDDAEFASGMEDSADNSGQVSSESVVAVLILWLAAFGNN